MRDRAVSICFNPCFDGSEARVLEAYGGKLPDDVVSILVLMEVKREMADSRFDANKLRSFNPCFDGSEARADGVA